MTKELTHMENANKLRDDFSADLKRSSVLSDHFIRQIDLYMQAIQSHAFSAGVDSVSRKKRKS